MTPYTITTTDPLTHAAQAAFRLSHAHALEAGIMLEYSLGYCVPQFHVARAMEEALIARAANLEGWQLCAERDAARTA